MSEEPIIIEIDDSQLDIALMKLDLLGQRATKTFGSGKSLDRILPSINRDLRLILGQIPEARPVMQAYFAFGLRPERGWAYYKKSLAENRPELMMNVYLLMMATALRFTQLLIKYRQQLDKQKNEYELLVRKARGWTHEEFIKGTREWENYLKGLPP